MTTQKRSLNRTLLYVDKTQDIRKILSSVPLITEQKHADKLSHGKFNPIKIGKEKVSNWLS